MFAVFADSATKVLHRLLLLAVRCITFAWTWASFDAVDIYDNDIDEDDNDNIGDGRDVINDAPQTRRNIIDAYF